MCFLVRYFHIVVFIANQCSSVEFDFFNFQLNFLSRSYYIHYIYPFWLNVRRVQFTAVSENRISEVKAHAVLIKQDAPRPFLARDVAASVIWVACDRRHGSITFPRVVFWSRHSFP